MRSQNKARPWARIGLVLGMTGVVLVTAIILVKNDGQVSRMSNSSQYTIQRDCDFSKIHDTYFSSECSPVITDMGFTGILINVPETVKLGGGEFRVDLACTYAHRPTESLNIGKPLENAIIFVAVDLQSNEVFSGSMPDEQNPVAPPDDPGDTGDSPSSPADVESVDKIVEGYVNLDLAQTLGLPAKPAEYSVYATVDKYKSNVLDLKVVKAGE